MTGMNRVAKGRMVTLMLTWAPQSGVRGQQSPLEGSDVVGALKPEQNSICRKAVVCGLRKGHSGVFGEE